jgi:hypothetical protein
MLRRNVSHLFELADDRYAVMCVQHDHRPQATSKMDGQIQTSYARKNWSSVMLFNVEHPGNARLTVEMINRLPGRDLHRFCWLRDDEIGALPPEWNFLAGNGQAMANPALVHFTNGLPDVPGCEAQPFADDWRALVPHAVGAQW